MLTLHSSTTYWHHDVKSTVLHPAMNRMWTGCETVHYTGGIQVVHIYRRIHCVTENNALAKSITLELQCLTHLKVGFRTEMLFGPKANYTRGVKDKTNRLPFYHLWCKPAVKPEFHEAQMFYICSNKCQKGSNEWTRPAFNWVDALVNPENKQCNTWMLKTPGSSAFGARFAITGDANHAMQAWCCQALTGH